MSDPRSRLEVVPLDLASASEFIRIHHRHHKPPVGHKFSLGVVDAGGGFGALRRSDGPSLAAWTTGGRWRSTESQRTAARTHARLSTRQHGGRRRRSDTAGSSPTRCLAKAGRVCAEQGGAWLARRRDVHGRARRGRA